ncbi:MAG TPA: glycosyltransferase family 9 protein [Candidatus Kryptonia bacterium]
MKKINLEHVTKKAARWLLSQLSTRHHVKARTDKTERAKRIIVIRQHNQFGDVLCTVPLLRALHRHFNPEELAVVVSPANMTALEGCRYVTRLINYDKLAFYRHPKLLLRFIKELRRGYDLLLVPSNVSISLTNDVISFFTKARTKFGPRTLETKSNRTSSVYDIAVDLRWGDKIEHQSFRNMEVAAPLRIETHERDGELEYAIPADAAAEVDLFISRVSNRAAKKVAIHAGAGKPGNQWKPENFAAVADMLHHEFEIELYLTEGHMDHEVIDYLTTLLKAPFIRVRNMSIPFVGALLKKMDLVISNDTGIMHLAAAAGAQTLSLFGPTDPLQWAPLGRQHRFVLGAKGDINTIQVGRVVNVVRKMLT